MSRYTAVLPQDRAYLGWVKHETDLVGLRLHHVCQTQRLCTIAVKIRIFPTSASQDTWVNFRNRAITRKKSTFCPFPLCNAQAAWFSVARSNTRPSTTPVCTWGNTARYKHCFTCPLRAFDAPLHVHPCCGTPYHDVKKTRFVPCAVLTHFSWAQIYTNMSTREEKGLAISRRTKT